MKPLSTLAFFAVSGAVFCAALSGQGTLNPAKLGQPPTDTWPTYHGD
jgi:hypothetical protein